MFGQSVLWSMIVCASFSGLAYVIWREKKKRFLSWCAFIVYIFILPNRAFLSLSLLVESLARHIICVCTTTLPYLDTQLEHREHRQKTKHTNYSILKQTHTHTHAHRKKKSMIEALDLDRKIRFRSMRYFLVFARFNQSLLSSCAWASSNREVHISLCTLWLYHMKFTTRRVYGFVCLFVCQIQKQFASNFYSWVLFHVFFNFFFHSNSYCNRCWWIFFLLLFLSWIRKTRNKLQNRNEKKNCLCVAHRSEIWKNMPVLRREIFFVLCFVFDLMLKTYISIFISFLWLKVIVKKSYFRLE